jgi:signal transduction histidine kinase/CheY-like chemotaxis protein/HPt (histidine-containing phosphotransfer) domain-containing protein
MAKTSFLSVTLSRWEWRHWLVVIGTLLAVTLTPLGWIQWQQVRMLDDMSSNQVESYLWQAYQLDRELSRLDRFVSHALIDPSTIDAAALQVRYEVFLSRIDLLISVPRRDLLQISAVFAQTIAALQSFSAVADPLFAEPEKLLASPAQLAMLDDRIDTMLPLVSELAREANRAGARFLDERNNQLHTQGVLVITLATVQAVAMLAFVGLLVLYFRRQQRRYLELLTLSQALEEARDQAEAANHGKTVFLANMSHEIRTPFQGLLGMLTLLDEPNLSGRQRDYLQTARDSAMHLLGVLNDILDVSTMESGTLKLSVTPVPLHNVAQEVDDLMQVTARDKGLELRVEADNDLPEWVLADATRVRQILYNLINNAIKFTPEGSVRASISCGAPGQPSVVMTVRDTGVGMDSETVKNLFTRFYQADNSLRRRIGGAGLGLEISRNLARMMGGDIRVQSEPGAGSVFTVTLELAETTAPEALHSSMGMPLDPPSSLRVLVAEDHPINLKYMSILLEKMGHEAVFCENGQEALQLLVRQPFDVVLLDYHMPVLDGLATTEAIRLLAGEAAQIPVILVTADVVNDTRKRALEVGVSAFASKPLQGDDLRHALRQCGLLGIGPVGKADAPPVSTPLQPAPPPVASPSKRLVRREEVIDDASYDEICDMMPDGSMHEMLDTVFTPPVGTVPQLLAALDSGDRAEIHYKAHTLKGTAMLLGFRALAKTAARIEHLSADSEGPALPTALSERLIQDMEATQQALCETPELPTV